MNPLMFPKLPKRTKRKAKKGQGKQAIQRRVANKLYMSFLRPAFMHGLAAGQGRRGRAPLCERCGKRPAAQLHHMAGRAGDKLIDSSTFAGLCFDCHALVHENPEAAKAEGWLESRYSVPKLTKRSQDLLSEYATADTEEGEGGVEDAAEGLEGFLLPEPDS